MGQPEVSFETYWQICCNCGMHFGMPNDFDSRLRENHHTFYCPSGHPQSYLGKTEEQKLREKVQKLESKAARLRDTLNYTEEQRDSADRRGAAARGQITKIKNRISKGICPCCNRSFENLKGHMETEHPNWNE